MTLLDPDQLFERWKEVEGVAMHFNELILDFRMKALGAISLVASGLGALALRKVVIGESSKTTEQGGKTTTETTTQPIHDAITHAENLKVVGYVLLFLAAMWAAAFVLDNFYYHELLLGAVKEAEALELAAGTKGLQPESLIAANGLLSLSTRIEHREVFSTLWSGWQRHFFYAIPYVAMTFGFYKCRSHALAVLANSKQRKQGSERQAWPKELSAWWKERGSLAIRTLLLGVVPVAVLLALACAVS